MKKQQICVANQLRKQRERERERERERIGTLRKDYGRENRAKEDGATRKKRLDRSLSLFYSIKR